MSTFVIEVCLWYIDYVTVNTTKNNTKYLVQHYSVFSARPGLGYGTLIQFIFYVHYTLLCVHRKIKIKYFVLKSLQVGVRTNPK